MKAILSARGFTLLKVIVCVTIVACISFGIYFRLKGISQKSAPSTYLAQSSRFPDRLHIRSKLFGPLTSSEIPVTAKETEELVRILSASDNAANAVSARPDRGRALAEIESATEEELEGFIARNPTSGWNPSVHKVLALRYQDAGRITKELQHWIDAWNVTAEANDGHAKVIADYALVHGARLMASLGRLSELEPLVAQYQNRTLSEPHLAQIWARTCEALYHMRKKPGIAYMCGPYALNNVAKVLHGRPFPGVLGIPSTTNGFSLAELSALADANNVGMVAAVRAPGADWLIPAVVHWKQNHYAAITKEVDGWFQIDDPTFPKRRRVSFDTLEEESSGFFLVPANAALPEGWRLATAAEMLGVYGKGYYQFMPDDNPPGCTKPGCCPPEEGPEGTGSGDDPCGMPFWEVLEPNINLEVSDIPMKYEAAKGPDFVLKLSWRQRNPGYLPFSYISQGWESDLLSFIRDSYGPRYGLVDSTIEIGLGKGFMYTVHFSGSSLVSDQNESSGVWAVRSTDGSGYVNKIELYFRNGAKDTYEVPISGGTTLVLKARADATGQAMTLSYDDPTGWGSNDRLRTVTLADGAQFTFNYDPFGDPYQITNVTGPNSRSVSFGYTSWVLTSITDAVGITSSFTYDPSTAWITSIVTPYGTNSFSHFDTGGCAAGQLSCDGVDRSVVITEPAGSHQVYLFYDNAYRMGHMDSTNSMTNKIPATFASSQIPSYSAGDPSLQTLDTIRDERNSHYWNRQQAALISPLKLSNLNLLTNTDYIISRTRHWLLTAEPWNSAVQTISWELPPSHDGINETQPIFYDYPGKDPLWDGTYGLPYQSFQGTNQAPTVISQRMPDGTTRYEQFERNFLGMQTRHVERWYQNGVMKRTNEFTYATGTGKPHVDNLLKVQHKGPHGEIVFGRALHSTYNDQIGRETNAVGEVTVFNYNANRQMTTKQTHAGLLTTYTYDSVGRLTNEVDSISGTPLRTNSYTWLNGYMRTHKDPRGLTRTYDYDFLGRATQIAYDGGTTETFGYSLPAWTGFNQTGSALNILDLVTYKDRMGNYSRTLPNRNRQVEKIIEPSRTTPGSYGTEHTITYCGCGSPLEFIRGANSGSPETNKFAYNYQGSLTIATLPNNTSITNKYDLLGRLSVREDALMKLTNVYDNLSRVVERRNGAGLLEGFGYDRDNHLMVLTNSSGVVITNLYDNLDRLLVRGYPNGGKEMWSYTLGFAEATRYTNQINKITTWAYDAAQRRTNEVGVGVYTNSFSYTPANDLRELLDGKSQKTTWVFDAEGRMTRKTNQANALVLTNGYNANAQLTGRWTAQKGLTSYSYDGMRNLTFVNYPSTTDITYQYNAVSRLTNMIDAAGTTKFTYNTAGDLLTEDAPWSNDTVTYGYHPNVPNLRTSLSLQQPSGSWSQSFGYDSSRRLQTVTSPAGTFTYTYSTGVGAATTASTLWKKLALFSGSAAYITNAFDSSGRTTDTWLKNNGHTILNRHTYVYNNANQRTNQTFIDASTAAYTYDNIGQLKSSDSSINTEDRGYLYDAAWNLNVRTNNGVTTTFLVNVENELTSVGGVGCTYDNNGNITSDGTRSFSYNDENQLTSVSSGTTYRYDFVYDGMARLRRKLTYIWSSGNWSLYQETRYLYHGQNVIQERDGSDFPLVAYTRGWDVSGSFEDAGGIGGMLARSHGYSAGSWSTHNGYHADGSGNITAMVSTAQAISASYKYDPFGNLISSSGGMAGANAYRFSSKMMEVSSGLYHYGYRFYHPTLHRWLNQDPLEEAGGINLYQHTFNDPINFVDPDGRFVNVVVGGATSVGMGMLMGYLSGCGYSWEEGLTDALTGAAGVGIFNKVRQLHRLKALRDLAKNRGLNPQRAQKGVERYVGPNHERLDIKHVGNLRNPHTGGINNPGSFGRRAQYRVDKGQYKDPFSGKTGPKRSDAGHIPLEATLGEAAGIGAAQGGANNLSRGNCD